VLLCPLAVQSNLFAAAVAVLQDAVTPVLSVMLLDIVSALAPELRICLLQMLPSMALQIGRGRAHTHTYSQHRHTRPYRLSQHMHVHVDVRLMLA
jgi:hypothetical protein